MRNLRLPIAGNDQNQKQKQKPERQLWPGG